MSATGDSKILFPWERRRGLLAVLRRTRARQLFLLICVAGALVVFRLRDQRRAQVRQTRAAIAAAVSAIDAWRADHDGRCPPPIGELVSRGYLTELPLDAWGRPLRVTCPGRRFAGAFDVTSDGPDGVPGGLDQIE